MSRNYWPNAGSCPEAILHLTTRATIHLREKASRYALTGFSGDTRRTYRGTGNSYCNSRSPWGADSGTGEATFEHPFSRYSHGYCSALALDCSAAGDWLFFASLAVARRRVTESADSALGASNLPGAQGVRGALRADDSAAARMRGSTRLRMIGDRGCLTLPGPLARFRPL